MTYRHCTYVARAFLPGEDEPAVVYAGLYTAPADHFPVEGEAGDRLHPAQQKSYYRGSGSQWQRWLREHPEARVEMKIDGRQRTRDEQRLDERNLILNMKQQYGERCVNIQHAEPDSRCGPTQLTYSNWPARESWEQDSFAGGMFNLNEVLERIPLARHQLLRLSDQGNFPTAYQPTPRITLFKRAEVEAWMDNLPTVEYAPGEGAAA